MEDQILQLTAEKLALEQSLDDQIRLTIALRKCIIFRDKDIQGLNQQIQKLIKELEDVKKSLEINDSSTA